ncbi:GNAT family N-acetyltransferase [Nocardia flavorosea]|uniref:GNAT family N-acetyltransferase n=1 Tax=Nocardia flavorosea TaxID=53429 RepID=A0A846YPH2_9NOCA|nr:GNAT family N-acetyltransferase [Nocardia flavorosea]NKY59490.1 GNAT family N-acetyltransferase [Nocardia flavorosea]
MHSEVTLRRLDEDLLQGLLDVAVTDADPREVMPPVAGPAGWTGEHRTAFLRFHRSRSLSAEPVESTYAIVVGDTVVGAARLCPMEGPSRAAEAGVWIGRSHRGSGVGGAVLRHLLALARADGFDSLFASTTPDNTAAQRVLAAMGATSSMKATLSPRGSTSRPPGKAEADTVPATSGGSTGTGHQGVDVPDSDPTPWPVHPDGWTGHGEVNGTRASRSHSRNQFAWQTNIHSVP